MEPCRAQVTDFAASDQPGTAAPRASATGCARHAGMVKAAFLVGAYQATTGSSDWV